MHQISQSKMVTNAQLVRLARQHPFPTYGRPALWGSTVNARNIIRRAIRRYRSRRHDRRMADLRRRARKAIQDSNRNYYKIKNKPNRRFVKIDGQASAGTTHTTTRMIVRRTPRQQKFLRKLLKTNPLKQKLVNRYGFAWMGAAKASRTIWYSCCHLKFNNLSKYMKGRLVTPDTNVDQTWGNTNSQYAIGNNPDAFIYIGKCTFSYELYNPTNYIMTVYIYDLICKHDTPYSIVYNDVNNDDNSAPEACMQKGAESNTNTTQQTDNKWVVGDPTYEASGTYFNTIGMKPTDYHLFNVLWKVKGIKKIVLPPTSSHHHVVVFNPKKKLTQAALYYPRNNIWPNAQRGVAGLTQATLFGFNGQVAVENDQSTDNTTSVGTLPGKLIVNCVRKINVWTATPTAQTIISETALKDEFSAPKIFTDLVEQTATAT